MRLHPRFPSHPRALKRASRLIFPLAGLASLDWFLCRVLPKPSRASYPCMKVAGPAASGFLAWLAGLAGTAALFRGAGQFWKRSHRPAALGLAAAGLLAGVFALTRMESGSRAEATAAHEVFVPIDPPNTPVGTARGIFPGRVVWMWDSSATSWSGTKGNFWDAANTRQDRVDAMLARSLRALTGRATDAAAWDALFRHFNRSHGRGETGYRAGEKVAVKINLNLVDTGNPGNRSFPTPQTVLALLRQMVNRAGVAASDITFYDTNRNAPKVLVDFCRAEFPDVRFMGYSTVTGRDKYRRDASVFIHWSQPLTLEIGGGHTAYLPTAVTEAAYLVNLASFKGHRYVGVTSCAKNHFGTFSADDDGGSASSNAPKAAGVHPYVTVHDIIIPGSKEWTFYGQPMGVYNALVDLMGHRDLGEKTVLFLSDALYGVPTEQDNVSPKAKWLIAPFNNDWTSSLFLSQDGVALESVGIDFYRTESAVNTNINTVYGSVDNHLHEASRAGDPPSGTVYDPEGDGTRLTSLGAHEHWDGPDTRRYTRNLGTGEGIELYALHDTLSTASAVEDGPGPLPCAAVLHPNHPNPFNPGTVISFDLPRAARVTLSVYDSRGRRVALILDETRAAGAHSVAWDAGGFGSGMYLARLDVRTGSGLRTAVRKMLLQK